MRRQNENGHKKEGTFGSESDDTIIINDSTYSYNDNEYEPTTKDLEISAVSTPKKHTTIKKQTPITNTFHITKKELETMQQSNNDKEIVHDRHQTQ